MVRHALLACLMEIQRKCKIKKASRYGAMRPCIRVIGLKGRKKGKERWYMRMVGCTLAFGAVGKRMVKVSRYGAMELYIKETGKMTSELALDTLKNPMA